MTEEGRGMCCPEPGGRGYRGRIIKKLGICRVRFGEVELLDLSRLNQRKLLEAAARLARWNGRVVGDEIWELFFIGKQIYTSGLVKELKGFPFSVRRDILRIMGDTGASMGMFSYERVEGEEDEDRYLEMGLHLRAEIPGAYFCGQGEDRIYVDARRWKRGGLNHEDMVLLEERYDRESNKTCHLAMLGRKELLELFTEQMPVRGVVSLERGARDYRWKVMREGESVTEAEGQALDQLGRQMSVLHEQLDFIEELIIVDGLFEPGERQTDEGMLSGRSMTLDYRRRPYVIFRDEKKVIMARECLAEESYIMAVMKLYEDRVEFEEQQSLSSSGIKRRRRN